MRQALLAGVILLAAGFRAFLYESSTTTVLTNYFQPDAFEKLNQQDNEPLTIAYALTVTSCNVSSSTFLDGFAVVSQSLKTLSWSHNTSYSYQLYAFVHPLAVESCPRLILYSFSIRVSFSRVNLNMIKSMSI